MRQMAMVILQTSQHYNPSLALSDNRLSFVFALFRKELIQAVGAHQYRSYGARSGYHIGSYGTQLLWCDEISSRADTLRA